MDYFDEMSEERPVQFSAGRADFAPRSQLAPWHEDPRAMFRTVAGLAGIPGLSQAGMGMLGGAARAIDPAERMFRAAQPAAGMLASRMGQAGSIDPQLLRMLGYAIPAGAAGYGAYKLYDAVKGLANRGEPEKRSGMLPGMHEMPDGSLMADEDMKMAKRYDGAGPRRDKKLRDAEDEATRTG